MAHDFQADLDAVNRIDAVSTILDVACRTTGMRFAAVARVTDQRWIACKVLDQLEFGLAAGGELKVETTICDEIRDSKHGVAINDVSQDKVFCDHPTPALYGFKSYISMPIIRKDGSFFGTLCALDPKPANVDNPETIGMFKMFAELIATHLDAGDYLDQARAGLASERRMSELREQFIAVLGHDLRNPVAAVGAGARMLLKTPLEPKAIQIVNLMQGSVIRMGSLIDNLLDFARGRLGGGIVPVRANGDVTPVLHHVIAELQIANPDREIVSDIDVGWQVNADMARIGQLFSNLLANAMTHGAADRPVQVEAKLRDGQFVLSVANGGDPIPPSSIDALFQPFSRPNANAGRQGLGLGLYIASEIARAHDGAITVTSTEAETRFTFTMPAA